MAPVYEYDAIEGSGRRLKGMVDADGPSAARSKLRAKGLRPVGLVQVAEKRSGKRASRFVGRIASRELAVILRRFSTLLESGLPLVECIEAILEQADKPSLQRVFRQVRERVLEGKALWQALSEHPKVFNDLVVNMVRAGEESGSLDVVLVRLADLMEARSELQSKVRGALAYPIFMFVVGSGVLFFLVTFVIPQISDLFRETGQRLPFVTLLLIGASSAARKFWWIGLLVLAGGIFLWGRYTGTPNGQRFQGRLILRLPVVGSLETRLMTARFARTLGSLLLSGMPLLNALRVARTVVRNPVIADAVAEVETRVGEGASLSEPMRGTGVFPSMALHMIHSGERSGRLESMMIKVADAYEKEVTASLALMMSLLEPIMILVMGLAVGFIVVAVLLPIFEMSQGIR